MIIMSTNADSDGPLLTRYPYTQAGDQASNYSSPLLSLKRSITRTPVTLRNATQVLEKNTFEISLVGARMGGTCIKHAPYGCEDQRVWANLP